MKITKDILKKVVNMQHGEQIIQHYKLYKHFGKNTPEGLKNLNAFMVLSGLKTTREV